MKRVRVEYPFHLSDTDRDYVPGDEIEVSADALARIVAISVNMVTVLGEASAKVEETTEEKPKPKRKAKTKG
jgi:hypothetical protein